MSEENDNPEDVIMCTCSGTTCGQIYDLVMAGKDLDAISRWTGALSGCGGCEYDIEQFVKSLQEQTDSTK